MRAIQRKQFCAKNVKNDLNPTDLVKCNFCFETEGVGLLERVLESNDMGFDDSLHNIIHRCEENHLEVWTYSHEDSITTVGRTIAWTEMNFEA